MELTAALRSPDPTRYRSSLPVHQDGSCNGLQHYAALGGDIDGGKEVNLVPGEKPGDVYSKVAVEVAKLVDFDAANGHDIARALKGHIKRKVVKQTVRVSLRTFFSLSYIVLDTEFGVLWFLTGHDYCLWSVLYSFCS
jgi:DNA-directed RNA polymerase